MLLDATVKMGHLSAAKSVHCHRDCHPLLEEGCRHRATGGRIIGVKVEDAEHASNAVSVMHLHWHVLLFLGSLNNVCSVSGNSTIDPVQLWLDEAFINCPNLKKETEKRFSDVSPEPSEDGVGHADVGMQ